MALSFPTSLPDYEDIQEMRISSLSATSRTLSPYTFHAQAQANAGDVFVFRFALRPMQKDDAAPWIAFIKALRGGANTCLVGDPHRRSPLGSAATAPGSPLVAGASQTGTSLAIDGCPANATGYLLAGDWIQLGTGSDSRIYMVMEDASTNGSGAVTLTISPSLRASPADNAAVTVSNTVCACRLLNPNVEWSVNKEHWHEIDLEFIESI